MGRPPRNISARQTEFLGGLHNQKFLKPVLRDWRELLRLQCGLDSQIWFCCVQTDQAIMANNFGFFHCCMIQDSNSLKGKRTVGSFYLPSQSRAFLTSALKSYLVLIAIHPVPSISSPKFEYFRLKVLELEYLLSLF